MFLLWEISAYPTMKKGKNPIKTLKVNVQCISVLSAVGFRRLKTVPDPISLHTLFILGVFRTYYWTLVKVPRDQTHRATQCATG